MKKSKNSLNLLITVALGTVVSTTGIVTIACENFIIPNKKDQQDSKEKQASENKIDKELIDANETLNALNQKFDDLETTFKGINKDKDIKTLIKIWISLTNDYEKLFQDLNDLKSKILLIEEAIEKTKYTKAWKKFDELAGKVTVFKIKISASWEIIKAAKKVYEEQKEKAKSQFEKLLVAAQKVLNELQTEVLVVDLYNQSEIENLKRILVSLEILTKQYEELAKAAEAIQDSSIDEEIKSDLKKISYLKEEISNFLKPQKEIDSHKINNISQ
ncbi:Uncharacterised protein [Metamycoplasma arthritidis]|uniref:Hypothetical lipoprotein n=2 Tax=Metamycoplasma arthritidis TaxID=2111 RepID=B3PM81_META1|nr:hypothetical protein [Metamycoplasma arthritidis]ABF14410.1 hypothetical membrane lipoprotein precursor [Metamycoplasma arthritidis]ACF07133.1 hypothetical lipoprotein [Metamycoplasma arthritidis 158L3-1]VEU78659.1 Uncharacterised protein [Metamycoplasma arthritidis]